MVCTACNIQRLKAIFTLLFEDLVIEFVRLVERLVEPGASFFVDIRLLIQQRHKTQSTGISNNIACMVYSGTQTHQTILQAKDKATGEMLFT
jgi:hypothetical protein